MKYAAEQKAKDDTTKEKDAGAKLAEKAKEERFKHVQADGLVHKDGKRIDPETGIAVDENQLVKTKHHKHHHKKHGKEAQSVAQKKAKSKEPYDDAVEEATKLHAEKKAEAKQRKRDKKDSKNAILENTIAKDLEYVKTKHAHKHHEKESSKTETKTETVKKTEEKSHHKKSENGALAQSEKKHKHQKKTAVK